MAKLEFMRGDGVTHYFVMPTASWSAGGKLFFAAKLAPDDDLTDAAASISISFTDGVAVSAGGNTTYTCYFPPSATASIAMGSTDELILKGQFQWVSAGGVPTTFPGNNKYIPTHVYADIVRKTA